MRNKHEKKEREIKLTKNDKVVLVTMANSKKINKIFTPEEISGTINADHFLELEHFKITDNDCYWSVGILLSYDMVRLIDDDKTFALTQTGLDYSHQFNWMKNKEKVKISGTVKQDCPNWSRNGCIMGNLFGYKGCEGLRSKCGM